MKGYSPLLRYIPFSIIIIILFTPSLSVSQNSFDAEYIIDPLDDVHGWNVGGFYYGPETRVKEFIIENYEGKTSSVLGLAYDFTPEKIKQSCAYQKLIKLPEYATHLNFYMKGDGSGHDVWVYLMDKSRETHRYLLGKIDFTGWRKMSFEIKPSGLNDGGDFDGALQKPVILKMIWISRNSPSSEKKGIIYIDNLSISGTFPESDSIRVKVFSDETGNIFTSNQKINFQIIFENLVDREHDLRLHQFLSNISKNNLWQEHFTIKIPPLQTVTRDVHIPIDQNGCYTLNMRGQSLNSPAKFEKQVPLSLVFPMIEDRGDGIFGVCTSVGQSKGDAVYNMRLAALAGFQWVRDEMHWEAAEIIQGKLNILPVWEKYVQEAEKNNLNILLTLSYGNPFYDKGGPPFTEIGLMGFSRYTKTIGQHFKNRIRHYEVWNEYNLGSGRDHPPSDYLKLQETVYNSLKKIDPNNMIIGGSVGSFAEKWIDQLFRQGAVESMDVFSIIPHIYPGTPERKNLFGIIQQINTMMNNHGDEKPVWITEIGWPTHKWSNGVSEMMSAACLVRTYVGALANGYPEKVFWYNLQNDGVNEEKNEENFGLIRAWGIEEAPWAAKANFVAANNLTHRLHKMRFIKTVALKKELQCFLFQHESNEKRKILILWTNGGTFSCGIKTKTSRALLYDMLGKKTDLYSRSNVFSLNVTDYPVFIEGELGNVVLTEPHYSITESPESIVAGDTEQIVISGPSLESHNIEPRIPYGWKYRIQKINQNEIRVMIMTSMTTDPGEYELSFLVKNKQQNLACLTIPIDLTPTFTDYMSPWYTAGQNENPWNVKLDLHNHASSKVLSGRIIPQFQTSADGKIAEKIIRILPGQQESLLFPAASISDGELRRIDFNVMLDDGYEKRLSKEILFIAATKAKTDVTIDGKIGDWKNVPGFFMNHPSQLQDITGWKGPEDISGTGLIQWDEDYFYLCLVTSDDDYVQNYNGDEIWKGDSIQFGLDFNRENKSVTKDRHEFGFALSNGKIISWRWFSAFGKKTGEFRNRKIVIGHAVKRMIYELAIPWSEILPEKRKPEPGEIFGFSLIINDTDNDGRGRGWIRLSEGIGRTKDPNLYADCVLAPE